MSRYIPRRYQETATQYVLDNPRCALYAGMGLGKTVSTLTALEAMKTAGCGPTLVVAPLRVAQSVWPVEAAKWDHLRNLHVVPVVGTADQRRRALATPADVHVVNYENLPWLVETLGERCPYETIVADESTRLKGFRLRQGKKRSKALAKIAWQARRFIELTGTPAPNGLIDLWGQAWFLDRGQRLGSTYTAFIQRWFQDVSRGPFPVIVPRPGAHDEIQAKLRDLCLTIDPRDHFDLHEPVHIVVPVTMPAAARAQYDTLERELFVEIDGAEIEAHSAAAKTMKCIAEGTDVLTQCGWKPIEALSKNDQVWDGIEWTSISGVVYNGYTSVIECWGVGMTPDHKVLTTHGWKEAAEVINAQSSQEHDRSAVWLPAGSGSGRKPAHTSWYHVQDSYLARSLRLWERICNAGAESAAQTPISDKVMWLPARRASSYTRHDQDQAVCYLVQNAKTLQFFSRQRLEKLWSPRYSSLSNMERVFHCVLDGYGTGLPTRTNAGTHRREWELHQGELPLGYQARAGKQHTIQRVYSNATRSNDSYAGCSTVQFKAHYHLREKEARVVGRRCHKARVFDVLNAGPRQRFTVRGKNGEVFVVHNCLQAANGAIYSGPDSQHWVVTHDAKLEALSEIVADAAGDPVLVAYQFKSDLARILAAFPQARVLDKKPETIRDWNAGRIPMLVAHAASAGHGLNLQDGGHILVFFGHWWDLEQRSQIIERIGPVRQLQAGHDRLVYVYDIVAEGTIDELVLARHRTKARVQDLLLGAMKREV